MSRASSQTRSMILAAALASAVPQGVQACASPPTPPEPRPRMSVYLSKADCVVLGDPLAQVFQTSGSNRIAVDEVFKQHASIKGKKTITINSVRRANVGFGRPPYSKWLFFWQLDNSNFYPTVYDLSGGELVKEYVLGLAKCKTTVERLRHCFDYLHCAEATLAGDAHNEFAAATMKDLLAFAKTLPAEKSAARLCAGDTSHDDVQFHGLLLGGSGAVEHAPLLRSTLRTSIKKRDDVSGLLKGWMMLQPKEGYGYLHSLLADDTQPFGLRCSALDAAEFVFSERPDLIGREQLIASVVMLLDDQPDMVSACIGALRRAEVWECTDRVLALLTERKDGKDYIQSVIMFALRSPTPAAAAFIAERRKDRPDDVDNAENLLSWHALGRQRVHHAPREDSPAGCSACRAGRPPSRAKSRGHAPPAHHHAAKEEEHGASMP